MTPLSSPSSSSSLYWIRGDDREEYGPVTLEELKEWVVEDRAGRGTWVRREVGDWALWETYPELNAILIGESLSSPLGGDSDLSDSSIAPLARRFLAFFIDYTLLIFVVSFCVISVWGGTEIFPEDIHTFEQMKKQMASPIYQEASLLMKIVFELGHLIYFGYFLGRPMQTLGKRIMGIRVVDLSGGALSRRRGWMRGLISVFSLQFFWVGYLIAIFDPQLRTFHDRMAQTKVVIVPVKK